MAEKTTSPTTKSLRNALHPQAKKTKAPVDPRPSSTSSDPRPEPRVDADPRPGTGS